MATLAATRYPTDEDRRLESVTQGGRTAEDGKQTTTYFCDNRGSMTRIEYDFGTVVDRGAVVDFGSITYQHTPNGQKKVVSAPNAGGWNITQTYGYDSHLRLTSAEYAHTADGFGPEAFNLDDLDNRRDNSFRSRANVVNGLPTDYVISHATRVSHVSEQQEDGNWAHHSVTYDGRGNTTEDDLHIYTWDAFDRLASVERRPGTYRVEVRDLEPDVVHPPVETQVEYEDQTVNAQISTLEFAAATDVNALELDGMDQDPTFWVEFSRMEGEEEVWYRTPEMPEEDGSVSRVRFQTVQSRKVRVVEVESPEGEYFISGVSVQLVNAYPWKKISYTYDGWGRRVAGTVDGSKYRYVYDGYQLIEVRRLSDNVLTRQFVYGEGINEPLAMWDKEEGETFYYVRDDLNSVMAITDTGGNVVERYEYTAYGETRVVDEDGYPKYFDDDRDDQDGDGLIDLGLPNEGWQATPPVPLTGSEFGNPFGYAGMWRDAHTGLYHTHYREYHPKMGRWLTPDPAGYVDGQNLYAAYFVPNGTDALGLADGWGRVPTRWADIRMNLEEEATKVGEDFVGLWLGFGQGAKGLWNTIKAAPGATVYAVEFYYERGLGGAKDVVCEAPSAVVMVGSNIKHEAVRVARGDTEAMGRILFTAETAIASYGLATAEAPTLSFTVGGESLSISTSGVAALESATVLTLELQPAFSFGALATGTLSGGSVADNVVFSMNWKARSI